MPNRKMTANPVEVSTVLYPSLEPITVAGVRQQDPLYIDGAIRLWIRGQYIIGDDEWDLVDQLWAYLIDGLAQLDADGEWSTYFPDQPILLVIRRTGDLCEVRVEYGEVRRQAFCSHSALRKALLTEAERVFGVIQAAGPVYAKRSRMYHEKARALLQV